MTNMRLTDFSNACADEGQMLVKTYEPNMFPLDPTTGGRVVYALVRGLGCPAYECSPDWCDAITVCDDDVYTVIYNDELAEGERLTEEIRRSEYEGSSV